MAGGTLLNPGDSVVVPASASVTVYVTTGGTGGTVSFDASPDGQHWALGVAACPLQAPGSPETSRALGANVTQGWRVDTAGSGYLRVNTPTGFGAAPAAVTATPTATPLRGGGGGAAAPTSITQGGAAVATTPDGSITLTPAAGKSATLASGQLLLPDGTVSAPPSAFSGETGSGWYRAGAGDVRLSLGGSDQARFASGLLGLGANALAFGAAAGSPDAYLLRDGAANRLAQRNGTNAQEQRWYETYTDASNYGRGFAGFRTNSLSVPEFVLGAEASGTGTRRNVVVPNTLVVRQPGGTAGTNELQFIVDGSKAWLASRQVGDDVYVGTGTPGQYGVLLGGYNSGNGSQFRNGLSDSTASGNVWSITNGGNVAKLYLGGAARAAALVFRPDAAGGGPDAGITSVASGVIAPVSNTTGGVGSGWLQNTAGRARVAADVPESAAVMANVADLTVTVKSGRKYFGQYTLFAKNTAGADGLQFDLGGGTATFTDLEYGFSAQPAGSTLGAVTSTNPTTPVTLTAVSTSDAVYEVSFGFTCNAGGTVIIRVAELTHSTGTATVRKGSSLLIEDSPN